MPWKLHSHIAKIFYFFCLHHLVGQWCHKHPYSIVYMQLWGRKSPSCSLVMTTTFQVWTESKLIPSEDLIMHCQSCAQKRQAKGKGLLISMTRCLPGNYLFPITNLPCLVSYSLSVETAILVEACLCFLMSEIPSDDIFSED